MGLPGAHQRLNAALAVKICSEFILADPLITENPAAFEEGLEKVAWPGRAQKFISPDPNKPKISWFLDGAHTAESVAVASDWIKNDIKPTGKMTLLFNCTGGRNNYDLLAPLYKVHAELGGLFSSVIFTTNETYKTGYAPDLTNNNLTHDFTGQEQLKKVWNEIGGESSLVVESIEEAVEISFSKGVDVVVTGSLHLIGGVLQVLKADVV